MKVHKPKTIQEAIDDLQQFLECDMYSRFRPGQTLLIGKNGEEEVWFRDAKEVFKNERDFLEYFRSHFNILEKQIKKLTQNPKSKSYQKAKSALKRLKELR